MCCSVLSQKIHFCNSMYRISKKLDPSWPPPLSHSHSHSLATSFLSILSPIFILYYITKANDDRESRFVHDQLSLLAPIFLALSASTPIFRGKPFTSLILSNSLKSPLYLLVVMRKFLFYRCISHFLSCKLSQ